MSLAEFLKEPAAETAPKPAAPPEGPAAKLRKQVFLMFGSIIFFGLVLTFSYVAVRISSASSKSTPGPVSTPIPAAQPAPLQAVIPVATPTPSPAPKPTVAENVKPAPPVQQEPASVKPAPPKSAPANPATATPATATPAPVKPAQSPAPAAKPFVSMTEMATFVKADAPPKRKSTDEASFQRHDLNPKHGETYLQIAAYGPKSLDAYLRILDAQGRHPLVAPGPVENIYRVLVGPF